MLSCFCHLPIKFNKNSKKNKLTAKTPNHAVIATTYCLTLATLMKSAAITKEVNNCTNSNSPKNSVLYKTANTTINTSKKENIGAKKLIAETSTTMFNYCLVPKESPVQYSHQFFLSSFSPLHHCLLQKQKPQ